jgi:hypothetical protein
MIKTQKKREDLNEKEQGFPNNSIHIKNLVENEDDKKYFA